MRADVRFGSLADICTATIHVRFKMQKVQKGQRGSRGVHPASNRPAPLHPLTGPGAFVIFHTLACTMARCWTGGISDMLTREPDWVAVLGVTVVVVSIVVVAVALAGFR
jgi:hypothetical protein